jgi:hypothetical protein
MIVARTLVVPLLFSAFLVSGCGPLGSTYAAEVGHYEGNEVKWAVWGDFASLDECRDAAISRFNSYNQVSPGRATSWACLKKSRNGGYESRHR